MDVHYWETPIEASWHNANHFVEANLGKSQITVQISEEKTDRLWTLHFNGVKALKVLSKECSEWSAMLLPADSGFFTITDSPWFTALGLQETDPDSFNNFTHYVICCREEIVEVVATNCEIT